MSGNYIEKWNVRENNQRYFLGTDIVFVLSQYDGANIEQRTICYGWLQKQEAKLKIVGGDLSGFNLLY